MDISSSSEEEGEITNNLQQEVTEATTTCQTEQGNTDEQLIKASRDSVSTQNGYSRSRQLSNLSFEAGNPPDASQRIPSVDHTVKSPSTKVQAQGTTQMLTMVRDVPRKPVDSPRQSGEAESSSDKPLESEVSEDSSDSADSETYEPPEPIATASAESGQPTTPSLSPVLTNATSQVEKGKDVNPTAAQEILSTNATFQTVEMPSTVEPVKVRTRFLPTLARSAHIS